MPDTTRRLPDGLRRLARGFAAAAIATILSTGLARILPGPSAGLEGLLDDFRHWAWQVASGPGVDDPPAPVTVVDIDERTLRALGTYGDGYRRYHAKVVERLTRHGAGAVVVDILFKSSNQEDARFERTVSDLREAGWPFPRDTASISRLRRLTDASRPLEEAAAASPRTVFAAELGDRLDYANPSDWIPRSSKAWQDSIDPGIPFPRPALDGFRSRASLDNIYPALARKAHRIGLANLVPDPDGTVRRLQTFWKFPDSQIQDPVLAPSGPAIPAAYPCLALEAASIAMGRPTREFAPRGSALLLGSPLRIWRDPEGIRTSAPELTWAMCSQIRSDRARLDTLRRNRSGRIEPTRQVWLESDRRGHLATILDYPDSLGDSATRDLVAETRKEPTRGFNRLLGQDVTHAVDRFLSDTAKDRTLRLSNWIEIWWDRSRNRLASSIPALAGPALDDLLALDSQRIARLAPGETLSLGRPISIPVDAHGGALVPFQAPSQWENLPPDRSWIRHVSYVDVLDGSYDPIQIPGRVFVIGSSASALADFVDIPIQHRYPGVNVQASAILSFVWGDGLAQAPPAAGWALALGLALVAGMATWMATPLAAAAILAGLEMSFFLGAVYAFGQGIWLDMLPTMAAMPIALLVALSMRYLLEERSKQFLHASFRTYLSPELIDRMIESGEPPKLGGEARDMTAFFTDIEGFSSISELLAATDLVELINEYLTECTDILMRHQGALDKYIGDAIVAMFGAPGPVEGHAMHALEAALDMHSALARLRSKWKNEGTRWPDRVHRMRMRIGIHTGRIVTGNMGSELRMNYTMMGDDVNLAARLEGACKHYGVWILASQATVDASGPGFLTRELDDLRVVGRGEPVTIHEVLSRRADAPTDWIRCVELFQAARSLYKAGEFEAARRGFLASQELEPGLSLHAKTTPSAVFARRCESYSSAPPLDGWDGVHSATEK